MSSAGKPAWPPRGRGAGDSRAQAPRSTLPWKGARRIRPRAALAVHQAGGERVQGVVGGEAASGDAANAGGSRGTARVAGQRRLWHARGWLCSHRNTRSPARMVSGTGRARPRRFAVAGPPRAPAQTTPAEYPRCGIRGRGCRCGTARRGLVAVAREGGGGTPPAERPRRHHAPTALCSAERRYVVPPQYPLGARLRERAGPPRPELLAAAVRYLSSDGRRGVSAFCAFGQTPPGAPQPPPAGTACRGLGGGLRRAQARWSARQR